MGQDSPLLTLIWAVTAVTAENDRYSQKSEHFWTVTAVTAVTAPSPLGRPKLGRGAGCPAP